MSSPLRRTSGGAVCRRHPRLLALAVFVLLAVVHTWPLASAPGRLSRNDSGDALLNTWALAWVAHQLPRDPPHLFDANIFWPERRTLAYSEAMIVQGVLALPVLALGGSPVLAYNLVLIAGFALTGWAFCLLGWRWTGSWAAGYVTGSLAAFNSHVLMRLPHLQTQHVEFLALALFAFDSLLARERIRDAVALGVSFALQGLTSIYLLVFSTWAMAFAALARAGEWLRPSRVRAARLLVLAGIVAVFLLLPYLAPYYEVHRDRGFERTIRDAQWFAGGWSDYLSTGSRLHYDWWSARFVEQSTSKNFPGVIAMVLVAVALVSKDTRRDPRLRMCTAIAVGCMLVSLAPRLPGYEWLHGAVPLFRAVRVFARIGQIVLLALAVIAGFGVARLRVAWRAGRGWPVVAAALVVLVNLEALRAPFYYTRFDPIPPVYDVLRAERGAIVAELPIYSPGEFSLNAPYMLNATDHWHPMLNGYSGFVPSSYQAAFVALQTFPDDASLMFLRQRGVTHVVVHEEAFKGLQGEERFQALARTQTLQFMAGSGDTRVYRLR